MKTVFAAILTALLLSGAGIIRAQTAPAPHPTAAPAPATKPTPPPTPKTQSAPVKAKTKIKPPCKHESPANHDEDLIVGQSEAAWKQARNHSRQKPQALKSSPCVPPRTGDAA
ncbi:MAG: hypothetical protein ACRESX_02470 [Gammaproteobacteria bacterium]